MTGLYLPDDVRLLIDRLETAGFPTYAVGGCVRDLLLGITPHDYDLCTAALPEQTQALFAHHRLVLAGKKHGTIGVVTPAGVVEITTFRTEGNYQDNRHPQWVHFVPNVEADLSRRDFTINAMAYSPARGFADPFSGQRDLEDHILRTVGHPATRFQEDALRILRGVRFAVRFRLTPEAETLRAMTNLTPLMENLTRERIFDELCKLLPLVSLEDLLSYAPILSQVLPELAPMVGFHQHSPHHMFDVFTHTAQVTAAVPPTLELRWAALLHDVGKVPTFTQDENGRGHFYGHAQKGAEMADEILHRLKAPTALRERVVWLISHHMTPLSPDKKRLRRQISRWGMEAAEQLRCLQRADFGAKGTSLPGEDLVFDQIATAFEEIQRENACLTLKDLAINGRDLIALGFIPGRQIGQCLNDLLNLVLDETLPNDHAVLVQAAIDYHKRI